MDSLLASYASSDEEEEQEHQQQLQQEEQILAVPSETTSSFSSATSLFSSLPKPKSSSLFQSLPQPKSSSSSSSLFQSLPQPKQPSVSVINDNDDPPAPSSSKFSENTSLFSSLPKPISQIQQQQQQQLPQPKKVIQFKPPIIPIPKPTEPDDDDDDEEEEEERNRKRKMESSIHAPSVKSFLSSIPAPRNTATLGVQSSSGTGRRSIIETEAPSPVPEPAPALNSGGSEGGVPANENAGGYVNYESYSGYQYGSDQNAGGSGYYGDGGAGYGDYGSGTFDQSAGFQPEAGVAGTAGYGNGDGSYASYGAYGDYGQHENNLGDGSVAAPEEASGVGESAMAFPKKRGRHEIPSEIIEVKQDELIKNRPREDQVKLTGIALGPSYQPVSTKGKPSKLHKRKHQIGSLYFDMKQNETKLAERRAKGMLTKAETQAKYGW